MGPRLRSKSSGRRTPNLRSATKAPAGNGASETAEPLPAPFFRNPTTFRLGLNDYPPYWENRYVPLSAGEL